MSAVARRYAKALLSIGVERQSYDALNKELERAAETFQRSPELKTTLENPVFSLAKRRLILDELARRLGLSKLVRNFLMLLLDKGRIDALPEIARAHRALVDEHAGRLRASVTSARPLDPRLELRLKTALERQSHKIILLEKRQDPSIVGGLVTQLGDLVFDGSVRAQLEGLRHRLLGE